MLRIIGAGTKQVALTLTNLGNVALWDVRAPHLYDVVVSASSIEGQPAHDCRIRIRLREARFGLDGFFLNGRRLQLFGLNRHELYPYVGGAMPRRVMRRDADVLTATSSTAISCAVPTIRNPNHSLRRATSLA